ncbi:aldehyde dehydrogenase [Mycolicibacterium sphagni]|uniref:aldehyde dehydrogenase n=1 Tax=Mycolicibacterium sphagni TaxID=1786 RepID=UPI001A9CA927|nr:aldehyde dehydrogenase [Mycolicibacterium sphagni]
MADRSEFFIGGGWVRPSTSDVIEVISPITEKVLAVAPAGSTADIDAAVAAARTAFASGPWPRMTAAERADVLDRLVAAIAERSADFAMTITEENGSPLAFSELGQVGLATMALAYFAALARHFAFEEEREGLMSRARVIRSPVGVVGAIVPWNIPLLSIVMKLGPALAAGCTVVVKPSPETPLDSYILAECLLQAGIPDGVVNIVPGGRETGEHLVSHPGVDKISFTGSVTAGQQIGARCGRLLRPVTLELGGKSAAVLCEDVDLSATIPALIPSIMGNNGQMCVAQTRVLAPRARYHDVVEALAAEVSALSIGDPRDKATDVGPLVSQRQRDRVESYLRLGRSEGARVAAGGGRPDASPIGWFIEPTVFADVDNGMRIAQEEIFGPVVAVIPYESSADAVRIANDSVYGLSGSVWGTDIDQATAIARQVRTGTITVNGFAFEFNCPFGGVKSSGIGREFGPEGLSAFLEDKTLCVANTTSAIYT